MQRSILSFFSKLSDSNESKTGGVGPFCDLQNVKPSSEGLADANVVDDVNENWSPIKRPKRRRLILDSSEDESDDLSCVPSTSQEKSVTAVYSCTNRSFAKNLTNSPKSSSSLKKSLASEKKNAREASINDLFDTSTTNSSFKMNPLNGNKSGVWPHLAYDFLQPSRIKDACGRQPSHPDYDPRTLFVPDDFLRKQSPALRQWWILKSQNFDTLLFFKMGKFYELYHMDAVIAVDELKLSYMRGEFAHSGFPEIAFQRMADRLLHRGYKVARVEQTETPENMVKRTSGRPGADKVVRREICQVITPGTWFAPLRNGISSDSPTDTSFAILSHPITQPEMETDLSFNRYLLVLLEGHSGKRSETLFGVALLKAATGEIMIGQFSDDIHYSQLCTTIAHFPPSQILFERGNLTTKLRRMLKARLPNVPFEGLAAGKQFLSARETICMLESANYFALTSDQSLSTRDTSSSLYPSKVDCWPADLLRMLDPADALGRSTLPEYELAVRCLGAVVFYLRYCLTDTEILSLGLIREYRPQKVATLCGSSRPFYEWQVNMVLDSITLDNLEVLTSNFNDTLEGTLLGRLDACCTSFGRRLLRFWVVNPPCQPNVIIERQEAIQELMELNSELQGIRDVLRRLPDLERLLTKVHIMGWNGTRPDHPESRAIVVDEITYSKRKIMDFLVTLSGFKSAIQIIKEFSRFGVKSELLRSLTSLSANGGSFPDYSEQLTLFDKAFDHEKAKRDGCIAVEPGFDSEFDKACEDLKRAEQVMEDFLTEQSDLLGCQLSYTGTGKNRFQLEVPEAYMSRVPNFWEATGQRKGFRRFRPPALMELFTRVVNAEDAKHASMHGIMRRLFASFSSSYSNWQAAVKCIAELDCLLSLANYSLSAAAVTCRPEFYSLAPGIRPFLEIVDGLHPCLTRSFGGGDITPNDMRLGHIPDQEEVVSTGFKAGVTALLITGPNMGGKSTLMRQTALLAILAHLGCHIPARSCRLTPIDRVFTRIGASDRLISGQSTFYVELAEAAVIINQATAHSLVLMDELGRGTSTRDGSALASAVIRHLTTARPSGPLTLFSTHYHGLVATLQKCQAAASLDALDIGHMACLIGDEMTEEQSGDDDLESSLQRITFLYKLVPSACPKSYGFNVAHLAQVPNEIINKGAIMAREFEKAMLVFSCLRDILSRKVDRNQARRWLSRLRDLSRKKMYGSKQEK